ncbi:hypothetical protein [Streptomyces sp. NPDC058612]|uniref:hypothetical protein n=1 Tax=Streptomyces sp. NPDC058612 TaxID=3346555 RepID=UPI003669CBD6
MITWLRTNGQLRAENGLLKARLEEATSRPPLVVTTGHRPVPAPPRTPATPPPPAAAAATTRAQQLIEESLRRRIRVLEQLKTLPGAEQARREAGEWRERAAAHEQQARELTRINAAKDLDMQRTMIDLTGQLAAANAQLTKAAWARELRVGPA